MLLVTSRRTTGLPGESRWPLGPLSAPDAVALLVDRSRRVDPAFAADPELLATLVELVDGYPLAIELLAARANVLSAQQMHARPDDRFALLRRRGEGRHDNLEAVVSWSWSELDEPAGVRAALDDLDGTGLDTLAAERANLAAAREHALGADPARPGTLVRRAVIAADMGRARTAEALLEDAEADGERGDAQLLRGWLAVTFHAVPDAHRLETAERHYRRALALFEAAGDRVSAFRARYRLGATDLVAGRFEEGLHQLRTLVQQAPAEVPRELTATVWIAIGRCQARLGRLDEALASFEHARTVLGDDTHRLAAHLVRGAAAVHAQRGDLEPAREGYDRVLELYRRYDDRWGEAHVVNDLAELARQQGDLDAAERGYHEALRLHRALGTLAHGPRVNLALVALERGHLDEARAVLDRLLGEALEPYLELVARAASLVHATEDDAWDDHLAAVKDLSERTGFVHPDLARAFRMAATRALRPDRSSAAWRLAAEQYEGLGDPHAASEARAAAG